MDFSKDSTILRNLLKDQGRVHSLASWIAHEHTMFEIFSDEEGREFSPEMESGAIIDFVKESERLRLSVNWVNTHVSEYRSCYENNSSV